MCRTVLDRCDSSNSFCRALTWGESHKESRGSGRLRYKNLINEAPITSVLSLAALPLWVGLASAGRESGIPRPARTESLGLLLEEPNRVFVEVQGDEIIVTALGFYAAYSKPSRDQGTWASKLAIPSPQRLPG
jgi:hypothetical protein